MENGFGLFHQKVDERTFALLVKDSNSCWLLMLICRYAEMSDAAQVCSVNIRPEEVNIKKDLK